MLLERAAPHASVSVTAEAVRLGVGVTAHACLGADIVHMHPAADGAAVGEASMIDFQHVCKLVHGMNGGVWINVGCAVVLPEVYLKAVSVAINLGATLDDPINLSIGQPDFPVPDALKDAAIAAIREEWLAEWMPKLTSDSTPLNPYRVLHELQQAVDIDNTIITHDAGSPRDQITPFWSSTTPLSYIGWGKTTQLGYGLGLAMGAKLAQPDKLCINVMGDSAIGISSCVSSCWMTLPIVSFVSRTPLSIPSRKREIARSMMAI